MIEIVSETRCIACDICVRICPADVFDPNPGSVPLIARQDACQTCFLCELYCPTDALYVDPNGDGPTNVREIDIEAAGVFGSYAREMGWKRGSPAAPISIRPTTFVPRWANADVEPHSRNRLLDRPLRRADHRRLGLQALHDARFGGELALEIGLTTAARARRSPIGVFYNVGHYHLNGGFLQDKPLPPARPLGSETPRHGFYVRAADFEGHLRRLDAAGVPYRGPDPDVR